MTLPVELVKAVTEAPCLRYPEDFKCGEGHNLSDSDDRQHPECVLAAVLRALRKSEAVKEALIDAKLAGRHEVGEGYHFNTNEQAAVKATVAIAKLADDA